MVSTKLEEKKKKDELKQTVSDACEDEVLCNAIRKNEQKNKDGSSDVGMQMLK